MENELALAEISDPDEEQKENAIVARTPTARGSGRGLKAIQSSKELSRTSDKADGAQTQSKQKIKEQKLYKAASNEHVETKSITHDSRKTTRKDGSTVTTECKTMKKVCYM